MALHLNQNHVLLIFQPFIICNSYGIYYKDDVNRIQLTIEVHIGKNA